MAKYTRENGRIIKCMDAGNFIFRMAENMKESTLKIRNMAEACIIGPMEGDMMVNGAWDTSMEKE